MFWYTNSKETGNDHYGDPILFTLLISEYISVCFYLFYLIQYVLQYQKTTKCNITFCYGFSNLVSLYNIGFLLGVLRSKSKILLKALFQTSLFIHTHSSLILCVCTKLISKSSFSITKEKNKRPHQ